MVHVGEKRAEKYIQVNANDKHIKKIWLKFVGFFSSKWALRFSFANVYRFLYVLCLRIHNQFHIKTSDRYM